MKMEPSDDPDDASAAEGRADGWVARKLDRESCSHPDEQELERWLAQSPRHREEYRRSEAALDFLGRREVFPASEIEYFLAAPSARARPWRRRLAWTTALAAVFAVLLGAAFYASTSEVQTGAGERRTVVLRDDTQAELDAGTHLRCRFLPWSRTVRLETGGAVFRVAVDARRPFSVQAGNCAIRDTGTIFDVHVQRRPQEQPARVEVAVLEGSVEIRSTRDEESRTVRLQAGEQATWNGNPADFAARQTPTGDFAAWREGRLRYRATPLGDVLADLQRYSAQPLVLADPRQASLAVTGTLRTEDLNEALEVLRNILPLKIRRTAGRVLIEHDAQRESADGPE